MKKTMLPLISLVAGLFLLPVIGRAQAIDSAFVNGNLGSIFLDRGSLDGNDISYGVNLGYRWSASPGPLIGFEAGYVDLGKYSFPASITQISGIGTPPTDPATYFGRGGVPR